MRGRTRGGWSSFSMEVCVDSLESAINAQQGGAARIELCSNLLDGGLTPSLGLYRRIKRSGINIPIFVMIRPRGGDFCYSDLELEVMREDIEIFKSEGADGIVFGILNPDGNINKEQCRQLLDISRPLPVTFHRAFDMTSDPKKSLEDIISLGFSRVLTSGAQPNALQGLPLIKELVSFSSGRVIIVPGGGVTCENLEMILKGCVPILREFHGSATNWRDSSMKYRNETLRMGMSPEYSYKVTNPKVVAALVDISKRIWNK